jgi:hypothetical protein
VSDRDCDLLVETEDGRRRASRTRNDRIEKTLDAEAGVVADVLDPGCPEQMYDEVGSVLRAAWPG